MNSETARRLFRRTLPLALLAAALSLAGLKIYRSWPREVTVVVRYPVPRGAAAPSVFLEAVDLEAPEKGAVSTVFFPPPPGAEGVVERRHAWRLLPGRYAVRCELGGQATSGQNRVIEVRESTSLFFEF